jgi:murein L,D-transpeptidase YcbB/YkuD
LKDSLENGLDNKSIASLRKRLFKEIGIPKDTTSTIMQDDLQTAINSFQYLHDLKLTGKLDTSTVKRLNTSVSIKIKHLKCVVQNN